MLGNHYPTFMIHSGTVIEDALQEGWIKNKEVQEKHQVFPKKPTKVNAIFPQANTLPTKNPRVFTPVNMSYSKLLKKCVENEILKPLEPRPLPNPLPAWYQNEE
ncbi:hypothetical protein Tsubulata_040622 [Turnera subulata]|uniref:Uncharacterized protein n=1 Tax=Turnera subulata TaxID=218843 RepID=A0A9Q0JEF7_9ROSI|nr:hypothetical protein Tsubulata_040622 [Turnera subulata]